LKLSIGLEKDKERSELKLRATQAAAELKLCEDHLQCVIEGIGQDQLLVRFFRIHRSDYDREFSFVLDVSNQAYKGMSFLSHSPSRPYK